MMGNTRALFLVGQLVLVSAHRPPPALGGSAGATCNGGTLAGGNMHAANLTIAAAADWCQSNRACRGWTAEATCGSSGMLDVQFKDAWGADRPFAKAGWAYWRPGPPPPPSAPPPPPPPAAGSKFLQFSPPVWIGQGEWGTDSWQPLGPGIAVGRMRGVWWKTVDGGQSFSQMFNGSKAHPVAVPASSFAFSVVRPPLSAQAGDTTPCVRHRRPGAQSRRCRSGR
jgi:hypothetical protein